MKAKQCYLNLFTAYHMIEEQLVLHMLFTDNTLVLEYLK